MSLQRINEAFKKNYQSILKESVEPTLKDELRQALDDAALRLGMSGTMSLKAYEVAFQEAIERVFPDKCWWEVTDSNIFWTLFETRDITATMEDILNKMKPEALTTNDNM